MKISQPQNSHNQHSIRNTSSRSFGDIFKSCAILGLVAASGSAASRATARSMGPLDALPVPGNSPATRALLQQQPGAFAAPPMNEQQLQQNIYAGQNFFGQYCATLKAWLAFTAIDANLDDSCLVQKDLPAQNTGKDNSGTLTTGVVSTLTNCVNQPLGTDNVIINGFYNHTRTQFTTPEYGLGLENRQGNITFSGGVNGTCTFNYGSAEGPFSTQKLEDLPDFLSTTGGTFCDYDINALNPGIQYQGTPWEGINEQYCFGV